MALTFNLPSFIMYLFTNKWVYYIQFVYSKSWIELNPKIARQKQAWLKYSSSGSVPAQMQKSLENYTVASVRRVFIRSHILFIPCSYPFSLFYSFIYSCRLLYDARNVRWTYFLLFWPSVTTLYVLHDMCKCWTLTDWNSAYQFIQKVIQIPALSLDQSTKKKTSSMNCSSYFRASMTESLIKSCL